MENPLYIYIYWFIIIWRFPRSLGHRGYSQLSSKSWLKLYDHLSIETHGDFGIPHFRTSPGNVLWKHPYYSPYENGVIMIPIPIPKVWLHNPSDLTMAQKNANSSCKHLWRHVYPLVN